jgi:hypothetical protein
MDKFDTTGWLKLWGSCHDFRSVSMVDNLQRKCMLRRNQV